MKKIFILVLISSFQCTGIFAQGNSILWHGIERSLRYSPDNGDFVITNGSKRFNRALYGSNTAFRVEAGDLPEFSMYLPGMGGNLKFGLITDQGNIWLNKASRVVARYRPGSMIYQIQDKLLGKGTLTLTVLALTEAEGMIIKASVQGTTGKISLFWVYGGVSGAKFSRNGDLNVDPESNFYLKPENCKTNTFEIKENKFTLYYGAVKSKSESERYNLPNSDEENSPEGRTFLSGLVPVGSQIKIADASNQDSPLALLNSEKKNAPVLAGSVQAKPGASLYFVILNSKEISSLRNDQSSILFENAEKSRLALSNRIKVETPDPFINTLGGTLAMAADAIWETPTYMHGAIGWRMRLNGWRGPYTADPLGWHDRAKTHFTAYVQSQVTSPDSGPSVPDPEKNLARQKEKMGVSLFTSGYVCRNPNGKFSPNHYDMNLVFFDAMLRHFKWTGDTSFLKEMWPAIKRHLAWEKRNFDANDDGLYDAYCCIWASDALQYSGGGVTHSSAYNYYAEKTAAYLAGILGEDPEPYKKEAAKILNAMYSQLWMPSKGWFAEYKDLLGLKLLHPSAALWTIYHTIDSEVSDPFSAYTMTRYVDTEIPHIPVLAKGLPDDRYYVLSTTNWMPYDWSLNNVVMAENLHTSLAYWQAGRSEEAFKLWKSTILDAMYIGSSPGNFAQLSFYDAARGEAYRDFADEVGMTARSLVEGLFGIQPDVFQDTLTIRPGLPDKWDHANFSTPDISFSYKRKGNNETYSIEQVLPRPLHMKFELKAFRDNIKSVTLNGVKTIWKNVMSVGNPEIEIVSTEPLSKAVLAIEWSGEKPVRPIILGTYSKIDSFEVTCSKARFIPPVFWQHSPNHYIIHNLDNRSTISAELVGEETGNRTVFGKIQQGQLSWFLPICFDLKEPLEVLAKPEQSKEGLKFSLKNNSGKFIKGKVYVNSELIKEISINPSSLSDSIIIPSEKTVFGSNLIELKYDGKVFRDTIQNWEVQTVKSGTYDKIDLSNNFNDKVSNIFAPNKYLSPRCPYPTLALPSQGIGNWCYPNIDYKVNDTGLRNLAGSKNEFTIPGNIPFATPGNMDAKNIIFTSRWDNYPSDVTVPLSGRSSHAYLLMAGSTNTMQTRMTNGEVIVEYTDGQTTTLKLVNPDTWWPIEQDYFTDGFAFYLSKPKPYRVHLETGLITRNFSNYSVIKGYSDRAIKGGAATVLDLALDPSKELKCMKVVTETNDVVIGLMSVTLKRD